MALQFNIRRGRLDEKIEIALFSFFHDFDLRERLRQSLQRALFKTRPGLKDEGRRAEGTTNFFLIRRVSNRIRKDQRHL